jgi:YD repeat-containing protein
MRVSGLARPCVVKRIHWILVGVLAVALTTASQAGTSTYTYDAHGRLTSVSTPNGSVQTVTTYTYDNAGNRTAVTVRTRPPNPPGGVVATAQAYNWIRLTWNSSVDASGAPVASYKVYRPSFLVSAASSPYDDQSVGANTPYTYYVSSVDSWGNESALSSPASATTPPGPDLIPPTVPGNLQGSAVSGTWINLTWTASTDSGGSGLAGYEIFRNNGGSPIGTSTVASYADQTVTPATTYLYTVRAYDGAGNRSGMSNQISVSTPDTIPPGAPGAPTFSAVTGTSATANWTAASDNVQVTGYRYSLNGGASWTNVGLTLTTNLTGLSLGTTYTMYVQAGDGAGNWGPSSSNSFITNAYGTDSMSMYGVETCDAPYYTQCWDGYNNGGWGSLTPTVTFNGRTIYGLWSYVAIATGNTFVVLIVDGTGNPGVGWLQSLTVDGTTTLTGASATNFTCSSGQCSWYWTGQFIDFQGSHSISMTHQ